MTRAAYAYETEDLTAPCLGLIALQSDETIEVDMRRLLPDAAELLVSRVPSAPDVTRETLAAMEGHLGASAALLPAAAQFDVIGYGCTSGTAQISAPVVAGRIAGAARTKAVTEPLSSLIAACAHLGLGRIALLSPYVGEVSARLRTVLAGAGIETPVFGSFDVAQEATVVRISERSIIAAASDMMRDAAVDALFLSCTNLRALGVIDLLERECGKPVLSSNQVLAWHMMRLAGIDPPDRAPGQLFRR